MEAEPRTATAPVILKRIFILMSMACYLVFCHLMVSSEPCLPLAEPTPFHSHLLLSLQLPCNATKSQPPTPAQPSMLRSLSTPGLRFIRSPSTLLSQLAGLLSPVAAMVTTPSQMIKMNAFETRSIANLLAPIATNITLTPTLTVEGGQDNGRFRAATRARHNSSANTEPAGEDIEGGRAGECDPACMC